MARPDLFIARSVWLVVGLLALGLGGLGVVLPLLPTTPFLLVAAAAFARSSPRLEQWLLNHRLFGALIANWQRHGAIDRSTKWFAVLSMVAVFVLSLALGVSDTVLVVQAVVLTACGAFVVSRPAPP